jgi:hypothetical protein
MTATAIAERARHPHDPSIRGYHAIYRQHEINRCPGCGRSHWYLGRASAECGFCATALPFATAEFASQRTLDWR